MTVWKERSIPSGWHRATLGELGKYWNGRGFKKSEWSKSGRPIIRIQNLTGQSDQFNHFQGEVDPRIVVKRGDLLMSWAATLGVYIWDGPEAVLNQHIFRIESRIHPAFHRYLLESVMDELRRKSHGSGMVHITRGRLDETEVWVPPIDEQRAIVAAIEAVLSRLDSVLTTLKRLMIKAQRLQAELLESEVAQCEAPRVRLQTLLRAPLINGRSVPTAQVGDSSFPVLRLTALQNRRIVLSEHKRGAWSREAAQPFLVRAGDFLVARGNGSISLVGRGGLVSEDADIAFPDTMIRVRPDVSRVEPTYLALVWDSQGTRSYIERTARTTAGIYKINQGDLERLLLPVPEVAVQRAIATRVLEVTAGLDRLKESGARASRRGQVLRSSILAAALTGRLVDSAARAHDDRPWVSRIQTQEVPA